MRRKKFIVIAIITFIAFASFAVYFFTIRRVESLLEQLVKIQSNGELNLKVKKVELNVFRLRFDFMEPELWTKDDSTIVTGYRIKAKSISFQAKSFIPFLLSKRIDIDSVLIFNPVIEVFKYKEGIKKKISLPEEMGKVYQSLEIVLKVLNLNYLHINSGRLKIFDYLNPANKPVEVSRLNLTVNKASSEKRSGDKRFLYADRIFFEVFNQDIIFSDGLHGIKFKRFSLNTQNQTIKLDSCSIYGSPTDSLDGEYNSFVDTVRISKLDLNLLVNNDILKMDSALCINPVVTFMLPLKQKRKSKNTFRDDIITKDSLDFVLKKMLGNLDIGYLTIKNANVKIVTKRGNESNVYNTSNSNFIIEKVLVNRDPKVPVQVGRFNLEVRNYVGYSPDSLYVVRFDNVQILNKTISLLNFRIGPSATNHDLLSKEITMESFEFNNINWSTLLYESRIVAGNVILIKPELNFTLPGKNAQTATNDNRKNPFSALEEIRNKVQIEDIFIKDGSMRIEDLKGIFFSIDHLTAKLNVNQLLHSTNAYRVVDAVDTLFFADGEYKTNANKLLIHEGSFSKKNNSLKLSQIIRRKADNSTQAKLIDVNLKGIKINSSEKFLVEEFTWAKADLSMNIDKNDGVKAEPSLQTTDFKFEIGKLSGGPTMLNVRGNNLEASTLVNQISAQEIIFEGNKNPKITGLYIDGQSFILNQNQVKSSISSYHIQDQQTSTLNNVTVRLPVNNELVNIFIPKLILSANVSENINGTITADFIELQEPVISFTPRPVGFINKTIETGNGIPNFSVRRLTMDQPKFANLPGNLAGKLEIDPGKSIWNLIGLHSNGEVINVDQIHISLAKPIFRNDKIRLISTGKESVTFDGSDFKFIHRDQSGKSGWSVKWDSIKSEGLHFNMLQNDTVVRTIAIHTLNFENLILDNKNVSDINELIQSNDHFRLSNGSIAFENSKNKVVTHNLRFDKISNSLLIDSLTFDPLDDQNAFMKAKPYQRNYMRLNTGLIAAKDIDFNLIMNDAVVNAKKLTINDLHFYDYRDKHIHIQQGMEKPLPTDLVKRIRTKLLFDSLLLKNAMIEYEEFNDKTEQHGKVKLSKIKGAVMGIRNYDFSSTDSLRFNIYTRFMDATDLRVGYVQSYTDSLSEFHLKVIVSSFDLRALNPMLKPIASALVMRGYLDTLRMSVIGRKYVAFGTMKMYYHNLNLQYLNKGNEEHKTLKSRMFTFIANRFVNNKKLNGSGDVYAERDPEKGFVNYWVKILIGGVLTNTGVRKDKNQEKKYHQLIEKYKIPLIQDIPVNF